MTPPASTRIAAKAPFGAFAFLRPIHWDFWRLAALCIALFTLAPVIVIFTYLGAPDNDVWTHLKQTVLFEYITHTLLLALGVGVGTALVGVSLAWLTAVCDFPGRRFFSWSLMLPLALPAYVTGFVMIGVFDFTGPVQTVLRDAFGPLWFPPIRSGAGVAFAMTLALYPYVYLLARNAFLTQGRRALEAAQSLGLNRRQGFYRVALPLARPWIAGGVALVIMETLADFGTVAVFNYDTFTTGIYKAWFSLFSLPAAAQLASLLIIGVFVLLVFEQYSRNRMRYTPTGRASGQQRFTLQGKTKWLAAAWCALILFFAFALPVGMLAWWAWQAGAQDLDARYFSYAYHSLLLGALSALLCVWVATWLAYAARQHRDAAMKLTTRLATLGYAVPGAVLAIGSFSLIAWFDNGYIALMQSTGVHTGQILQGTLVAMLAAYLTRFLAVAHQPVEAAMQRITRSQDNAARSLGLTTRKVLTRIHLPALRGGLLTAALLVFVDVMKEMPITLMTRPFGWDTLATRIFEMTSEGEWERAALPAVALVLAGLIPVVMQVRHSEK